MSNENRETDPLLQPRGIVISDASVPSFDESISNDLVLLDGVGDDSGSAAAVSSINSISADDSGSVYLSYKWRWFVLGSIALFNLSNAMVSKFIFRL